jgi:anti-sigma-K factor RskA
MTDPMPLAAEHALRLLEGEELMDARRRVAADPAFAAEVAWWEEQFSSLFDEIGDEAPSAELWPRIVQRLGQPAPEVLTLKRQIARWRAAALATGVAAAVLLGLQLTTRTPVTAPPPTPAPQAQPAPLLVASLAGEEAPEALTVTYRADSRELVVTPARIEAPSGRARQLWLIPAGGQPLSLGLVRQDGVQRQVIAPALAARFASGATVAVSDEPVGGSPSGQPTGAVLASGSLGSV